MSSEQITTLLAVVLSLVFSFAPGLKDWFDGLPKQQRAALIAVLCLAIVGGATGLACAGVNTSSGAVCISPGAPDYYQQLWGLFVSWTQAVGAAQLTYVGTSVARGKAGG